MHARLDYIFPEVSLLQNSRLQGHFGLMALEGARLEAYSIIYCHEEEEDEARRRLTPIMGDSLFVCGSISIVDRRFRWSLVEPFSTAKHTIWLFLSNLVNQC